MSNQSEISAATFYWLCPRDVLNQGRQTIALFHYEDPANDSVGEGGNFFFSGTLQGLAISALTTSFISLCMTRNLKVSNAGFIPM